MRGARSSDKVTTGRTTHPVLKQIQSEISRDGLLAPKLDEKGRAEVDDRMNSARAMGYVKFSK